MADNATHTDPPLFEVGRVVKPHGVRGEVAVHLLTDRPEVRFAPGAELRLDGELVSIVSSRPHQGRWLVHFEGVGDRTAAEGLRNAVLTAPPLEGDDDTDTFWVHELVGLTVLDEDGSVIGEVTDHIELPPAAGYDMLEVRRPSGANLLLPAVDDLVEAHETEDGELVLVVVDPPAGLLDEDEAVAVRSPGETAPEDAASAD